MSKDSSALQDKEGQEGELQKEARRSQVASRTVGRHCGQTGSLGTIYGGSGTRLGRRGQVLGTGGPTEHGQGVSSVENDGESLGNFFRLLRGGHTTDFGGCGGDQGEATDLSATASAASPAPCPAAAGRPALRPLQRSYRRCRRARGHAEVREAPRRRAVAQRQPAGEGGERPLLGAEAEHARHG
eukprot:gene13334-biopygen6539